MRSAPNQNAADIVAKSDEPDFQALTIERLRARAKRCRDLSELAHSATIAEEFERLAQDYEADAFRLEAALPRNRSSER